MISIGTNVKAFLSTLSCTVVLFLVSCLKQEVSETLPLLSCDRGDTIVLPGDSGTNAPFLDSMLISSNRSWTAEVEYVTPSEVEQTWLDVSVKEKCIYSGVSEEQKVYLVSQNNVSDIERVAKIVFHCQEKEGPQTIEVRQKGLIYRINCTPEIVASLDYKGAVCSIDVESNIPWHAVVVSGDADDISFIADKGRGVGKVEFEVAENPDSTPRQWEIEVRPDSGFESSNSFIVTVNQLAAEPYLILDLPACDTEIRGDEERAYIYFRTNSDWTAELKNSSSGVVIEKASGTKEDKFVSVKFGKNTKPSLKRNTTVVLSAGKESSSIDILQHGYITLYFSDGTTYISSSNWPFSSPGYIGTTAEFVNVLTPFIHLDNYSYRVQMTNGLKRNSKGLYFMGTTNDYIEFPSFADCRIVSISVIESGAGKKRKITDIDGNVVPGGEDQTCAAGVVQTWNLSDSKNGTPYRFTFHSANMNAIIREISIYYE